MIRRCPNKVQVQEIEREKNVGHGHTLPGGDARLQRGGGSSWAGGRSGKTASLGRKRERDEWGPLTKALSVES